MELAYHCERLVSGDHGLYYRVVNHVMLPCFFGYGKTIWLYHGLVTAWLTRLYYRGFLGMVKPYGYTMV